MLWLKDNWTFLIVIIAIIVPGVLYVANFSKLPTEEQMNKLREWLLFAVISAEKEYSSGTGRLKLVATYNEFCKVFPNLVSIVSFETFSKLVDDALVEMRKILETNKNIEFYVKGE